MRYGRIILLIVGLVSILFSQTPKVNIPLTIVDNAGGSKELWFGLDATATSDIDADLGETELPPFPPTGVFEARFIGSDISDVELGEGSYRDYRMGSTDFEGSYSHELRFQVGQGDLITISWNLPDGVTGELQDLLGGVVINEVMKGDGSCQVTDPGVISKLKMTIQYKLSHSEEAILTSPNGGEIWQSKTTEDITWSSVNIDSVRIEFTADGGGTWNAVVDKYAASEASYAWKIPGLSSKQCKVRIMDALDGSPVDESDSFFEIIAPDSPLVSLQLVITDDAGDSQILYFGLDSTATPGIDFHLGEMELPPFPPSGVFEARFVGSEISVTELGEGSYSDFRYGNLESNARITHELRYQLGAGKTITVGWNFPDNVSGLLQDLLGGVVINESIAQTGSLTIDNPGVIDKLKLEVIYHFIDELDPPELLLPTNGATNVSLMPLFKWNSRKNADRYHLQVADDNSFQSLALNGNQIADTLFAMNDAQLLYSTAYFWRTRAINDSDTSDWSPVWQFTTQTEAGVNALTDKLPNKLVLRENYPNPFNPATTFCYELPNPCFVTLSILNTSGQLVETLENKNLEPGFHSFVWDATHLSSGVYFYQLRAGKKVRWGKCLLLR